GFADFYVNLNVFLLVNPVDDVGAAWLLTIGLAFVKNHFSLAKKFRHHHRVDVISCKEIDGFRRIFLSHHSNFFKHTSVREISTRSVSPPKKEKYNNNANAESAEVICKPMDEFHKLKRLRD